jgi:hypothetical protein
MSEREQEGRKELNESLGPKGPVFRLKKRHDCGEGFHGFQLGSASKQASPEPFDMAQGSIWYKRSRRFDGSWVSRVPIQ